MMTRIVWSKVKTPWFWILSIGKRRAYVRKTMSRITRKSQVARTTVASQRVRAIADTEIFLDSPRSTVIGSTWNQRQHSHRAARAIDDLERRGDEQSAGRRQLLQVAEAGQAKF